MAPTAERLSEQRRRRLAVSDHTAEQHRQRLHHMHRHIDELQGPAAHATSSSSLVQCGLHTRSNTQGAATAPAAPDAATLSRQRHLRRAAAADTEGWPGATLSPLPPSPPPLGRLHGCSRAGHLPPRPLSAPPLVSAGLSLRAPLCSHRAGVKGGEEEEWQELKRQRWPVLATPLQPLELPPSRFNNGGPPLLPSVQHHLLRRTLLTEILDRQLFKGGSINALFVDAIAAAPPQHRGAVRTVVAELRETLRVPAHG